jgi:acylphosphatase
MTEVRIHHKDITITGLVQGVGFRYACLNRANSLGIKGIVKNLENGSVYIEAEGTTASIKQFIEWCHEGPIHAIIEEVLVSDAEIAGYTQFGVKH